MPKYLITGSEGFIGKNLCNTIGNTIKNSQILTFNEEDFDTITYHWSEFLERLVEGVDIIFHVGAISSTDASDVNNVMFKNYEFSKILFDLAAKYNKKVIYSSSAAIYGGGDGIPKNLYAWTKKTAEEYGLIKVKDFISLRYFNVYGGGETNKDKMASVACQAFFNNYLAYNLKGQREYFFPLLPKNPTRDFVYIKDVVNANIFAAENDIKTGIYEVGSGESRPFEDVLKLLDIPYYYLSEDKIPPWYQFKTQSNPERFLPGWKPEYNLEKGIKEYKEYLEEYVKQE